MSIDTITRRQCPVHGEDYVGCPSLGCYRPLVERTYVAVDTLKHELTDLVRRAAPFANAVAVMADDKSPALAWLADAAIFIEKAKTDGL